MSMSSAPTQILTESSQMYEDFSVGNFMESQFALPRARKGNGNKRKLMMPGSEMDQGDEEDNDDGDISGMLEGDDEVTEEDVQNIVKMTEYIEK